MNPHNQHFDNAHTHTRRNVQINLIDNEKQIVGQDNLKTLLPIRLHFLEIG